MLGDMGLFESCDELNKARDGVKLPKLKPDELYVVASFLCKESFDSSIKELAPRFWEDKQGISDLRSTFWEDKKKVMEISNRIKDIADDLAMYNEEKLIRD